MQCAVFVCSEQYRAESQQSGNVEVLHTIIHKNAILCGPGELGTMIKETLPIACDLTQAELQAQRETLLPGLLEGAQERIAVPDGYRWRFEPSGEFLQAAATVIDAERRCCRFLHFVLTIEAGGGPAWLEVTGPTGTAEFLDSLARGWQ